MKRYSFNPDKTILKFIKEMKLDKMYYLNTLLNYGLILVIQEININSEKFKIVEKSEIAKIKDFVLQKELRIGLTKLRKEQTHKAYFKKNVVEKLKHFVKDNIDIKDTILILETLHKESKTFNENEDTTNYIKTIINLLSKSKNYESIKMFLDFNIIETKEKNIKVEYGKRKTKTGY